jgi:hypothetical protein
MAIEDVDVDDAATTKRQGPTRSSASATCGTFSFTDQLMQRRSLRRLLQLVQEEL